MGHEHGASSLCPIPLPTIRFLPKATLSYFFRFSLNCEPLCDSSHVASPFSLFSPWKYDELVAPKLIQKPQKYISYINQSSVPRNLWKFMHCARLVGHLAIWPWALSSFWPSLPFVMWHVAHISSGSKIYATFWLFVVLWLGQTKIHMIMRHATDNSRFCLGFQRIDIFFS